MSKGEDSRNEIMNLWERVTLSIEKYGKKSDFLTRVEDIRRDSFILEMPIRQTGELHLSKGDKVEVSYSRADAVYSFKASILDLFEGDAKTIRISKGSQIDRIQRRRYVRLDISGKISFHKIAEGEESQEGLGPELNGVLLNISAGGLLFESPVKIKTSGFIVLSFTLKGSHNLQNILAVVKRCEGSKSKGYLVGAEFLTKANLAAYGLESLAEYLPPGSGTFDENLQKLVIKFIYDQQVELRKKGLLRT
jgi:c-di-GMP-binding flagellar brake protein YcgR